MFSKARFGGSFAKQNKVKAVSSARGAYPSGYNMSYLNESAAFIQGGSYGNYKNSIGPFVAKVHPRTLKPVWYTQLANTEVTGRLLAVSDTLPFMTQGSAVQPGYGGSVFFPGGEGTLVKLTPSPVRKSLQ